MDIQAHFLLGAASHCSPGIGCAEHSRGGPGLTSAPVGLARGLAPSRLTPPELHNTPLINIVETRCSMPHP